MEVLLPKCRKLTIFSAYITSPAIDWLSNSIGETDVCVVGRLSPHDFICGSSSFEALFKIIGHGWRLKCLPNLHAKLYLLDENVLFIGSANLTGKGLRLVGSGNIELMSQCVADKEDVDLVDKLLESSVDLDEHILQGMKSYICNVNGVASDGFLDAWPETILPSCQAYFVCDFPWGEPGGICSDYLKNTDLCFAKIEAFLFNQEIVKAKNLFLKSRALEWLIKKLDLSEKGQMYFGELSAALHAELADDPAPYRSSIKMLLANLLAYVQFFNVKEVSISRPNHSQLVRLMSC